MFDLHGVAPDVIVLLGPTHNRACPVLKPFASKY